MKKEITKKHNGVIGLWKFLFSLMIVLLHSKEFNNANSNTILLYGSIGVEFFFLVSGYLMAKKALNSKGALKNLHKETFDYVIAKYKTFLPYTISSVILCLIVLNIFSHVSLKNNILSIFEMFLLRMFGFKLERINSALWYIGAMLISMTILYPLIRKYKEKFFYIFVPVILLLIAGWFSHTYTSLRSPNTWIGFTYRGVIRALIGLTLGTVTYIFTEKIKKINFTKLGIWLLTIIELGGFILPFLMSHFMSKPTNYDYIVVVIIALSVTLAFSGLTLDQKICNNKFIYWLEKYSLPIYVYQWACVWFIKYCSIFDNFNYYQKTGIYLILVLLVALIFMYLIEYLKKKNYFIAYIKKLIVIEK